MDLFSTNVMLQVVTSLKRPPQFLLDRFFPNIQTEMTEEIHFDVEDKARRIAPFVSPVVEGKVVASQGFTAHTFQPAYVKDKRVFDTSRPLKRAIGERIGGALTPENRVRRFLAQDLIDQIECVDRRLEVMAAEALRTGAITVSGDGYPTRNVDFERDAGLTVVESGAAAWDQEDVHPLDDLQDYSQLVLQKSGAMPRDVVMTVDVWKVFRVHADVKDRLDIRRATAGEMNLGAQMNEGATYMGNIDGFNIFVYAGWYVNDAGTEVPILPAGTVILSGSQLEGVRAFGAIRDHDAGFMPEPYYPKSWVEPDPSVRYLLMQSAPIPVPFRVNAGLAATVL